jgi:hypothetical protein
MTVDDHYKPPSSALTETGPQTPVTRIDEAMIEYMKASRGRVIAFICIGATGCLAGLAGLIVALITPIDGYGPFGTPDTAIPAAVCLAVLGHSALSTVALARYLPAINRAVRLNDLESLRFAMRRRAWARVGTIVLIVMLCFSIFLPLLFVS